MSESLACWRAVSCSGFFHSANRAPFRSCASWVWPARRASFQTSRRTSSSASVANWITWNGRRSGSRWAAIRDRAGDPAGHVTRHRFDLFAALSAPRLAHPGSTRQSAGHDQPQPRPAFRCGDRPRRSGSAARSTAPPSPTAWSPRTCPGHGSGKSHNRRPVGSRGWHGRLRRGQDPGESQKIDHRERAGVGGRKLGHPVRLGAKI